MFLGPEASPKESRWRPRWLKMASEELQNLEKCGSDVKFGVGPCFVPPKTTQNGPKMLPRMLQNALRWTKIASRWSQDGPRLHQDGVKESQNDPKVFLMVPRSPEIVPRWPKIASHFLFFLLESAPPRRHIPASHNRTG